jgi:ribosome-binding ATPase YchF (GTP1/OBG family)
MLKQTQVDEISDKEIREKQFEPITQRLDKVEKTVKQTDEDLRKKLQIIPAKNKLTFTKEPKQFTFTSEEEEGGGDKKLLLKNILKKLYLKVE